MHQNPLELDTENNRQQISNQEIHSYHQPLNWFGCLKMLHTWFQYALSCLTILKISTMNLTIQLNYTSVRPYLRGMSTHMPIPSASRLQSTKSVERVAIRLHYVDGLQRDYVKSSAHYSFFGKGFEW